MSVAEALGTLEIYRGGTTNCQGVRLGITHATHTPVFEILDPVTFTARMKAKMLQSSLIPDMGCWYPLWAWSWDKILMMLGNSFLVWGKLTNPGMGIGREKDLRKRGNLQSQRAIAVSCEVFGKNTLEVNVVWPQCSFSALQFWAYLRNAIRDSSSQGQASEQNCSLSSRAKSALAVLSHCLGVTGGNHNLSTNALVSLWEQHWDSQWSVKPCVLEGLWGIIPNPSSKFFSGKGRRLWIKRKRMLILFLLLLKSLPIALITGHKW